jgi:hypothetical protein
MRNVKRLSAAAAVLAVLAVVGVAMAATASAADPLFLFGTKTGFTATGGSGVLTTVGSIFSITCEKIDATGKTGGSDTETFTGTVTFSKCNANSLGDASGIIKFEVKGLLCYISEAPLQVGLDILNVADVHLETALGLRVFLKNSSDVAALTPIATKTKTLTAKLETSGNGVQKVTSCVDLGTTLSPSILVQSNESGAETKGAIQTSFTITPEEEGTLDG